MHVLILVGTLRRDFCLMAALKEVLEAQGAHVTLASLHRRRWYLRFADFDAVVMPVGDVAISDVAALAKGANIHVVPTVETLSDIAMLSRSVGADMRATVQRSIEESAAVIHLWGERSRRQLLETEAFVAERLVVAGAARFDYYGHPRHRGTMATGAESAAGRPLGIVWKFDLLRPRSFTPNHFACIDELRTDPYRGSLYPVDGGIEDLYWVQAATARVLLDVLDECERRDQPILIRHYPGDDSEQYRYLLEKYPGIVSCEHQDLSLEAWLYEVCAVACFGSVGVDDIVASGRMGICFDGILGARLAVHTEGREAASGSQKNGLIDAREPADLFAALDSLNRGEWNPQQHYQRVMGDLADRVAFPRTTPALVKIANEIGRTHSSYNPSGRLRSHIERIRRWICRRVVAFIDSVEFRVLRRGATVNHFPLWERTYRDRWAEQIDRYAPIGREG